MKFLSVLGLTLAFCFNPINSNADPVPYTQAVAESYGTQIQPVEEVAQVERKYSDDDLYYLSRTIWGEARGEGRNGMLHVGSVIINRMNAPRWPKTIRTVVLQPSQFTTWRVTPRIRSVTQSDRSFREATEIAKHLLETGPINDYKYFHAVSEGGRGTRIGNHIFR